MAGNEVSCKDASSPKNILTAPQLSTALDIEPSANQVVKIGDTFTIKATLSPDNVTNNKVNWNVSDSSKATISATETTSGTSITVKAKKTGTVTITATPADGQAQYAKSITVTINPLTIADISPQYYGDYMDYPIDLGLTTTEHTLVDGTVPKTDWRVFYKDDTYVYLIASDYIPTSKFPTGVFTANNGKYNGWWSSAPSGTTISWEYKDRFLFDGLKTVNSSNANYKATSYFLNTNIWSDFINSTYSNACIGGPTLEMFCKSWNTQYSNQKLYFGVNDKGYMIGKSIISLSGEDLIIADYEGFSNTLYFPHNNSTNMGAWNDCYGFRMSSPSMLGNYSMWRTRLNGMIAYYVSFSSSGNGVRPVVMLKSTLLAEKHDVDGIWEIKGNSLTLDVTEDQEKKAGDTFTITPTVHSSIANKNVNWSSNNPSVATVSASTTVSGTAITVNCVTEGETTITASLASDTKQSVSFKLKVGVKKHINTTTGLKEVFAKDIYGATVTGYDCARSGVEWQIFYIDEEDDHRVYLIAKDYMAPPTTETDLKAQQGSFQNAYYWDGTVLNNYKKTIPSTTFTQKFLKEYAGTDATNQSNLQITNLILDQEMWSEYKGTKADFAFGGPTLPLFQASYNDVCKSETNLGIQKSDLGYQVKKGTGAWTSGILGFGDANMQKGIYFKGNQNTTAAGMYFASPSSNGNFTGTDYMGGVGGSEAKNYPYGCRPIISLRTDIKFSMNSNGSYEIVN